MLLQTEPLELWDLNVSMSTVLLSGNILSGVESTSETAVISEATGEETVIEEVILLALGYPPLVY